MNEWVSKYQGLVYMLPTYTMQMEIFHKNDKNIHVTKTQTSFDSSSFNLPFDFVDKLEKNPEVLISYLISSPVIGWQLLFNH